MVSLPFARGQRVSSLAAFNSTGFIAWAHTTGTFTRQRFHDAFIANILPHLNPWPMQNSIVIIDNAKIHMYKELEEAIASRGAIIFYLPPYSPQINPIETAFSLLKRYIQKHAYLAFQHEPELVLDVAFPLCISDSTDPIDMVKNCGYHVQFLDLKK